MHWSLRFLVVGWGLQRGGEMDVTDGCLGKSLGDGYDCLEFDS